MKVNHPAQNRFQYLIEIKKTERKWHFPFLAALCIGSPLLLGWFLGKPNFGSLSSLGALVILYFTQAPISQRMVHLAVCAFGMIFSFAVSLCFNFNVYFGALALGIVAFLSHFITNYYKIPPPGNFFFIMVAAMASNFKFDMEMIPTRIGLFAMGAILSCSFAFIYSVLVEKSAVINIPRRTFRKKRYTKFVESGIIAVFMTLTLIVGHLLKFQNTYWISISTIAIIQGRNFEHVRQRNLHRIIGTFVGLGLAWSILYFDPEKIVMIFIIMILQFIVELMIVRNYGFAVIFLTPLTILLVETGSLMHHNVTELMEARLIDTVIGSLIGLSAGFLLYHQQTINNLEKSVRFSFFQFKKLKK
ncbi:FUSC family protein [Chryseobacterium formosus]|uniref:FUSC family protein n=1 Tax=Chryseobacterium formosus TaxID=1537363 RepID=A0ABT3XSD1_9FLAO|nr:FUSC family protein [Chryseobacterium formosus]MCX8525036.1 FUSC family protein [Chryseobacterium formosus]